MSRHSFQAESQQPFIVTALPLPFSFSFHKISPLYLLCACTQSCECGRREAHGHAVCPQVQALICPQRGSPCQLAIPSCVPLNNHTLFSFLKPAVYPLFSLLSAEDPNVGNKDFPGIIGAVRGKSHVLPPTHLSRGQCLGSCSLSSLHLLWIELSTLHLKLNPSQEHYPSPLLQ